MFKNPSFKLSLLFILALIIPFHTTHAKLFNTKPKQQQQTTQTPLYKPQNIDAATLSHMRGLTTQCMDHWEKESCLKTLSALSMDVAVDYAQTLNDNQKSSALETLKQHCAASTAALKISVPAYAMKSALTECANTISDIHTATSIKPHLNRYQLLVGSILCLGDDKRTCQTFETQLLFVMTQ